MRKKTPHIRHGYLHFILPILVLGLVTLGILSAGAPAEAQGCPCNLGPYFVTTDIARTQINVHYGTCSSNFNSCSQPVVQGAPPSTIRLNGVSDVIGSSALDIIWTDTSTNERYVTTCQGSGWTTTAFGTWNFPYFGGADLDGNSQLDFVTWDLTSSPMTGVGPGPGFGVTAQAISTPWLYNEIYNSFSATPVIGNWQASRVYNLEDVNSDGRPDLVYGTYANGGASATHLYLATGQGNGQFDPPTSIGTVIITTPPPNSQTIHQPQNMGDLGDINGDGCTDWVGGGDDDGNQGGIYTMLGDCTGNFSGPHLVTDTCVGTTCAPPGFASTPGSGISQLYDWDCDGSLELLASRIDQNGAATTILYWDNGSLIPILSGNISPVYASPLRN